jgi:hypothetical protein
LIKRGLAIKKNKIDEVLKADHEIDKWLNSNIKDSTKFEFLENCTVFLTFSKISQANKFRMNNIEILGK